jgi:hypothetical protein
LEAANEDGFSDFLRDHQAGLISEEEMGFLFGVEMFSFWEIRA